MKAIDIKGKEYVTVNERLKEFRNTHKDYSLVTEIIDKGPDFCLMKASVIDDKGTIRATGFAREVVAKSPINKYAFVENCETSAIGRALGNFGIGIDEAICSADELIIKLSQEQQRETSANANLQPEAKPISLEQRVENIKKLISEASLESLNGENYKKKFNAFCKEAGPEIAEELVQLQSNRFLQLQEELARAC